MKALAICLFLPFAGCVLLALCFGCAPELQTACFEAGDLPSAEEVVIRSPRPEVDFDYRPQTRAAAEQAMWDFLHAALRGSSAAVMCVVDEGRVACESGALGPTALEPGRPYWACRWRHPEEARLPEGLRTMYFFPTPPSVHLP